MYNTYTLPNGLRVIHRPADSEVVYCGYAINAGARHELAGEEGLAHFCEHMTFKGTETRSALQVINTLERLGGEMNAYTAKEETVYYAAVLKQHFRKAVELLTDIVFHSTYPQQEIEKEVEVVCDEIDSYRDSPADLIYDEFENKVFQGSSLGHNVLGTKESVRSFTTEDCLRFTRRQYLPGKMVFYVVGGEAPPLPSPKGAGVAGAGKRNGTASASKFIDEIIRILSKADLPSTDTHTPSQPVMSPAPLGEGRGGAPTVTKSSYHQSHVMLGTTFSADIERWRIPLYIVNNILGGPAMNSRFNLSLRERRGLVYTVESLMTTYTDAIMWSVYFGSDKADANRCLRLIKSELQRLRRKPMTVSALNSAKRQLKGQVALAMENRENFAIDMAKQYLHRGTLRSNERLFKQIDAVTPDDIHQLLNEVLAEDKLIMLRL